ncbi:hypothetical protein R3P38DRAFT_3225405 [Favolaschia claudopus]|uniref:Uncharacterized protein n=1 Tax=Favolaschia claudopus TaxID=2862362 RepID=A0AAV9ZV41_9AGAR
MPGRALVTMLRALLDYPVHIVLCVPGELALFQHSVASRTLKAAVSLLLSIHVSSPPTRPLPLDALCPQPMSRRSLADFSHDRFICFKAPLARFRRLRAIDVFRSSPPFENDARLEGNMFAGWKKVLENSGLDVSRLSLTLPPSASSPAHAKSSLDLRYVPPPLHRQRNRRRKNRHGVGCWERRPAKYITPGMGSDGGNTHSSCADFVYLPNAPPNSNSNPYRFLIRQGLQTTWAALNTHECAPPFPLRPCSRQHPEVKIVSDTSVCKELAIRAIRHLRAAVAESHAAVVNVATLSVFFSLPPPPPSCAPDGDDWVSIILVQTTGLLRFGGGGLDALGHAVRNFEQFGMRRTSVHSYWNLRDPFSPPRTSICWDAFERLRNKRLQFTVYILIVSRFRAASSSSIPYARVSIATPTHVPSFSPTTAPLSVPIPGSVPPVNVSNALELGYPASDENHGRREGAALALPARKRMEVGRRLPIRAAGSSSRSKRDAESSSFEDEPRLRSAVACEGVVSESATERAQAPPAATAQILARMGLPTMMARSGSNSGNSSNNGNGNSIAVAATPVPASHLASASPYRYSTVPRYTCMQQQQQQAQFFMAYSYHTGTMHLPRLPLTRLDVLSALPYHLTPRPPPLNTLPHFSFHGHGASIPHLTRSIDGPAPARRKNTTMTIPVSVLSDQECCA